MRSEPETRELSLRLTYRTYGDSSGRIDATFGPGPPDDIDPADLVKIADAVGKRWGAEVREWLAEEARRSEADATRAEEWAIEQATHSMESCLGARTRAEIARLTAERFPVPTVEGARRDVESG